MSGEERAVEEAEEAAGVAVADSLDECGEEVEVVGDFAFGGVGAEEIAEDAAEVFVPGEAHEAAAIGEHADPVGEEPEIAEGIDLPFHAFFLIEEPPTGAELDFARRVAVHEVAAHGGEGVVVGRVDVVEDGFGERAAGVESVEEAGERFGLGGIADGVEAGVWAERAEGAGAVIAERAEVELFDPAAGGVEFAGADHDEGGELVLFERGDRGAGAGFVEDDASGFAGAEGGGGAGEPVVAETAALLVEELVTAREGVERAVEGGRVSVSGCAEPVDVEVPCFGLADAEEGVRAERGEDAGGAVGVFDGAVVGEGVGGVVGGADDLDVEGFEDAVD